MNFSSFESYSQDALGKKKKKKSQPAELLNTATSGLLVGKEVRVNENK